MNDSNITFEEIIINLISTHHEGGYWDFKREWYKKKGDLLHDIICMANNIHNRDAYIIIGINEEVSFCELDVTNDPNRKNTQNIIDFLKDIKFAGGIRPLVCVRSIKYNNATIDIIVIENSFQTPFFLTERYERIDANNIYTRIVDTNTPVNKSADINIVEYLWKKRFRLDTTPLEKIKYFIKSPKEWENSPIGYETTKFYKYFPEYTIKEDLYDNRSGYEFYFFSQIDHTPHWFNVTLYYHQTALEQFSMLGLDGCRFSVVCPTKSEIKFLNHNTNIWYCFYEKNTLKYDLLKFYNNDTNHQYEFTKFMECVLLFETEKERHNFELYVIGNKELYMRSYFEAQNDIPNIPKLKGYDTDALKKQYTDALALQRLLIEYKNQL